MKSINTIKVIYYSSSQNSIGGRLQRAIEMLFTREEIEIHRTIEALTNRLHRPLTEPLIFVIIAANAKELQEMAALQTALQDRRLILVLPDSDPVSVATGHSFRPRFLSYSDSDFVDVLAVLGKMSHPHASEGHRSSRTVVQDE